MTEEFKMLFLLALVAIGAAAFFQKRKSSDSGPKGLLTAPAAKKTTAAKQDRNGVKQDLIFFVQKLLKIVNKEKWYVMLPGTLSFEGKETNLNAIIVTKSCILGMKALGFGGKITKKGAVWTQLMNGKQTTILNVEEECQKQKDMLAEILEKNGLGGIPLEVIAVFTTPNVWLDNMSANRYHTSETALEYLKAEKFHTDEGIQPKEVGKKLEEFKYTPE